MPLPPGSLAERPVKKTLRRRSVWQVVSPGFQGCKENFPYRPSDAFFREIPCLVRQALPE
ncbi:hypothetical protein D9M72_590540 [compost metagenome]